MSGRTNHRVADQRPLFLLSSERSGSNLLRSILNTHSEISAPHPLETAYPWQNTKSPADLSPQNLRMLVRDIVINKRYGFHPLTVGLDPVAIAERVGGVVNPTHITIQEALYGEYADTEGSGVWTSKSPGLWHYLSDLFDYYDDCKFIYLVRDPRDVVLSFKTSNIELYHPYFTASRWREEQEKGIQLMEDHSDRVHLVQYESLLERPEAVVKDLCEFAELPFEEGMLYYYETEDAQAASQSADVFENLSVPIKSDNYGKFRDQLPDEEVQLTEKIDGEVMDHFGYELVHDRDELQSVEFQKERYRSENTRLRRQAQRKFWRESPREQLRRQFSYSFSAYMTLRYGVLG